MRLFGPRNKAAEKAAASAMRPGLVRGPLMILCFAVLIVMYRSHFNNRLAELETRNSLQDEIGLCSAADRSAIGRRMEMFLDEWGLRVIVHIRARHPELPELPPTALFIGITSEGKALLTVRGPIAQLLRTESRSRNRDLRLEEELALALCLQTQNVSGAKCIMDTLDSLHTLFLSFSSER
jgi:hypothetical protein